MLMSVVRWAQGRKVGAQYVLGDLRHLCRAGWQDPGETWDQEQQLEARQAICSTKMMAKQLQTNPT